MSATASGPVDRYFWARHANPWSVRAAVAAYPLLVLGLYRRDRRLLVATAALAVLPPVLVGDPGDDASWATRVVLGERAWLADGLASSPGDLLFLMLGAPVQLFTLRAALRRQPVRTALGTACSLATMLLFFRRMVRLYEAGGRPDGTGELSP